MDKLNYLVNVIYGFIKPLLMVVDSFMNKAYSTLDKISERKRLVLMTLVCFASDFINMIYVNTFFVETYINAHFIRRIMMMYGINPAGLSRAEIFEFQQMMMQTIGTGFFLILGVHFVIYTFAVFKKKFALHYIYWYAVTAAIITVLFEVPSLFQKNIGWGFLMLLTTSFYTLSFIILKHLKKTEEQ